MLPQIQEWTEKVRKEYITASGRVLEIGSFDINGGVRQYFTDAGEYFGTDMREGNGVDLVMNGHDVFPHFEAESFDTIICLETLEHDDKFWITINNIKTLLKPGGYLIIGTPTFLTEEHRHPKDYYRFGEDAYREVLLEGYEILDLHKYSDYDGRPGICAIGKKIHYPLHI